MTDQITTPTPTKAFYTSKTFWLNAVTMALLILPTLADIPALQGYAPAIASLSAVLNIWLRALGGTPLSVKKPPKTTPQPE